MSEVEFELRKLGDLIEIYNNKRVPLSAKQREGLEKIYPYYGAQGIVDYVDDYIFDGKYILIAEDGENLKSNNKSICTLATGKYWVNNHAHIIEGNDETNTDFLYYKLNSISFAPYITGSAQPKLNKENLLNIELYIPSKEHQDKIAKVLTLLDQKIQTNNQINQELEAMAKTLYDYWFVQFDFPDQNGNPYKSSGGKMVYHPELKREIPEGWGVAKVEDIAQTGSGGTPKSTNVSYYSNGEIPWINSGELEQTVITSTSNFITEEGLNNSSAKLFPSGTILVAMYGATAGKVSFLTFEASTNQAICAIMLTDIRMRYYLKNVIEDLYQYLVKLSTGSARDNLSQDMIKNIKVVIPSNDILDRFYDFSNNIIKEITKKQQENEQLTQLRDWLLPMLINGQVKVE